MRQINRPVEVTLTSTNRGQLRPAAFRFRGQLHTIRAILEVWIEHGQVPWWDAGNVVTEMKVWRVLSAGGGVFELGEALDPAGGPSKWILLVAHD